MSVDALAIEHKLLDINGLRLHVAVQGSGPLVVLCHGFPELWYSWRHQIPALAAAGFRVAALDLRGFGQSEAPDDESRSTILHLVGDVVQLVLALGEQKAIVIGHDWGAPVAWHAAMMRPDMFRAVVGMSVPFRPRGRGAPLAKLRTRGLERYYLFYYQTPEAVAEFDRDPAESLRKLLCGHATPETAQQADPLVVPEGRGFLDRFTLPAQLPSWLSEAELEVFVAEYRRTGFRAGLGLYHNIDRNWELTAAYQGAPLQQPALFIGGTRDPVLAGKLGETALAHMQAALPQVETVLIEDAGHWIQQERPQQVNAALEKFLRPFAS